MMEKSLVLTVAAHMNKLSSCLYTISNLHLSYFSIWTKVEEGSMALSTDKSVANPSIIPP